MDHTKKQSRVLKWSLIIGITIVLNLFFNYAISLIYPSPTFTAFCPDTQVVNPPATKPECLKVGGQWNESTVAPEKITPTAPAKPAQVSGYCNATYTCQKDFDTSYKAYERNVFIVLVILGVLSLLCGLFLNITEAVTLGLTLGGVLSLLIASGRYWSEAGNILKVIILLIALIALIWVGIKKFKE